MEKVEKLFTNSVTINRFLYKLPGQDNRTICIVNGKSSDLINSLKALSLANKPLVQQQEDITSIIKALEFIPKVESQQYFLEKIADSKDFAKSISQEAPNLYRQMTGNNELLRKTLLLDRKTDNLEEAYIFRNLTTDNILIHTKKENLGCMNLNNSIKGFVQGNKLDRMSESYKNNDFLEVHRLKTANLGLNISRYKGMGTELIKQAIIESYKLKHDGRIALVAENYSDIGMEAKNFYTHIGFTKNHNGTIFALAEEKIADFLLKKL